MEKVGDIMKRLGFREDAPDSLKRAFIRHLVRAAERAGPASNVPAEPVQLAFDLSSTSEPQRRIG